MTDEHERMTNENERVRSEHSSVFDNLNGRLANFGSNISDEMIQQIDSLSEADIASASDRTSNMLNDNRRFVSDVNGLGVDISQEVCERIIRRIVDELRSNAGNQAS